MTETDSFLPYSAGVYFINGHPILAVHLLGDVVSLCRRRQHIIYEGSVDFHPYMASYPCSPLGFFLLFFFSFLLQMQDSQVDQPLLADGTFSCSKLKLSIYLHALATLLYIEWPTRRCYGASPSQDCPV